MSDERLKQNIYTISQSLDKILDLRPTKYVWKKNKKQDVGFIAQEVEKIIPEVVEESRGFINDDSQIEQAMQLIMNNREIVKTHILTKPKPKQKNKNKKELPIDTSFSD